MSFRNAYQAWLDSAALSPEEKEELRGIANDPKEIESRFFDQLSFELPVSAAPCVPDSIR